ncbi:MAG: hypothetical protein ABFC67_07485 [Mizugakiibacter sp.]|uniref:hypothetical protein n=1 Tax=Mizugakiibacter sp. TaxID=1972610 RepID=UPI00320D600A
MTIKFSQDVNNVGGVNYTSGQTATLNAQTEYRLVGLNLAAWVGSPPYIQEPGIGGGNVNAVTGPNGEVSLQAGGEIIPAIQRGSTIGKSNQEPFLNHATSTYNFLGYDDVDGVAWINDATGGLLRQGVTSDAWQTQGGVTWSSGKGFPANVTYANVSKMLRFNGKIYMLALDGSDSLRKIWRCDPATGNTAFTWSGPLLAFAANATSLFTGFAADGNYIYACEYTQQASFTPKVYRSADGVTWETIIDESVAGVVRHFHCIAPDPYNPGHVWLTCGDGIAKTVQRSTDYGTTWDVVIASSVWQAVEISFTQDHVYFAGDSQYGIVYRMDRNTLTARWVTPALLKNIPVLNPAALTDSYYYNAWYGAVDPSTGDYYASANDASAGGNTAGLFIVRPGQAPVLCKKFSEINSPVVIAGGVLWVGKYRKVLNSYA